MKHNSPNFRYGASGFATAEEAERNATETTTFDDFILLHHVSSGDMQTPRAINEYAWVWPPEYGRSLLREGITEVERLSKNSTHQKSLQ